MAGSVRFTGRPALLRVKGGEGLAALLVAGLRLERHLLERLGRGSRRRAGRIVCGQVEVVEDFLNNGRIRDESHNEYGLGAAGAF